MNNALYDMMMQQGLHGSQSGPAQESDAAWWARAVQGGMGGIGLVGGAGLGAIGGGALGGTPGAAAGGLLGAMPGANVMNNADSPNIQDVWLHQYIQRIRRQLNGLPPY